jgi:hypothetical protein
MGPARHVIIGDIHGCLNEFNELLSVLDLTTEDTVILAGDLVDKGYDSAGVVKRARELRESGTVRQVVLVMGNHEEKHSRFRTRMIAGADVTALKGHEEMSEITRGLTVEDVFFLNSAILFHRIPGYNSIVVHAGIPLGLQHLPPSPEGLAEIPRKERDRMNLMLRIRYLRPSTGNMVPMGQEQEGDTYWAHAYDGRFGHVFFGHEPFIPGTSNSAYEFPFATGLDHGCVFGGSLTAMVLSPNRADLVSVKAHAAYNKSYAQEV